MCTVIFFKKQKEKKKTKKATESMANRNKNNIKKWIKEIKIVNFNPCNSDLSCKKVFVRI